MSAKEASKHHQKSIADREGLICNVGASNSGKNQKISEQIMLDCFNSDNLPIMSIVYDNHESVASVSKIKASLTKAEQYLVQDVVLKNSIDAAINPFDTQIGFRHPSNMAQWQITLFLMRLLTPLDKQAINRSTSNVIKFLVNTVYDFVGADNDAGRKIIKMYQSGYYQELDDIVVAAGEQVGNGGVIQAVELADYLHVAGERETGLVREQLWRGRDLAHRQAMPVLADLITVLDDMNDYIVDRYKSVQPDTGECTVNYLRRALIDAINDYPCFAHPTKIDTSKSHIMMIDVREVMDSSDPRSTNSFIQIAHKLATDKTCFLAGGAEKQEKSGIYTEHIAAVFKHSNSLRKKIILAVDGIMIDDFNEMISVISREKRKYELGYAISVGRLTDLVDQDHRFDILMTTTVINLFSKLDDEDRWVFRRVFLSNDDIMADLDLIDANYYVSYRYQAKGFDRDGFISNALHKKKPLIDDQLY